MPLTLKHFDTRNGQWLPSSYDGDIALQETLHNTLLEAFVKHQFPETDYRDRFSIGHIDEVSTAEDLRLNHPEGDVLLLTSGSRLVYGPLEIREQLVNQLNPDKMHNGAYGSLLIADCNHSLQQKVTYLVIDDSNGENGGYLDKEQAWRLVGDCHGKIAPEFSQQLSGSQQHIIQFRLGDLDQGFYAKGTFAPKDLTPYFKDKDIGKQIAFVVPTSSFKGAGKDTVKPGLYQNQIWLGEKAQSQRGDISLSQLLPSYPEALRDFLPELKQHLDELSQLSQNPKQLAAHYCQTYEKRKQSIDPKWQPPSPEETVSRYQVREFSTTNTEIQGEVSELGEINSDTPETEANTPNEEFLYLALKADPYHLRLLQTKKVSQALSDFIRRDYLESAIGKRFKFDRGMIIPSKALKTGEIAVPWIKEGEPVLEFRAPFLNHNGMRQSINVHVDDMLAPNGKPLKGAICVNDEDYGRILKRLTQEAQNLSQKEGVSLNLPPLPDNLSALSVDERISLSDLLNRSLAPLQERGLDIALAPYESDSEMQGRDFDGDCLGVAPAYRYPHLTQAVQEKTQPEQLFRPTRKEDKVSFPSQTPFEVMAIHMADNISVGVINNAVTRFQCLLSELELVDQYGTTTQRQNLAKQLSAVAQQGLRLQEEGLFSLPESIQGGLEAISTKDLSNLNADSDQTTEIFNEQRQVYRGLIETGCYQNQIAVDLFKSARTPDVEGISDLSRLLYRQVEYFKDKKSYPAYRTRPLKAKGHSPVELTSTLVNQYFQQQTLPVNPAVQYRDLFPADYDSQMLLGVKAIKAEYDQAYNLAAAHNRKLRQEDDLAIQVITPDQTTFQVVQYSRYLPHKLVNQLSEQPIALRLIANHQQQKTGYQLRVQYQEGNFSKDWKLLGFVCELSREQSSLQEGMVWEQAEIALIQSLRPSQVQHLFQQASQVVQDWRSTLSEEQQFSAACAAWHLCHNNERDSTNNFVYAAFGDQILKQLSQAPFQFNQPLVGKLKQYDQVPLSLKQSSDRLTWQIQEIEGEHLWTVQDPKDPDVNFTLGTASEESYQFPVGTQAQGVIKGHRFTTAQLEISGMDAEIILGNMHKYAKAGYKFQGESHQILLSSHYQQPPIPMLYINQERIGQLAPAAVELFQEHGVYRDITFEVNLSSYGSDKAREILATTKAGNAFEIHKSHFLASESLKSRDFKDEKVHLTLKLEPVQPTLVAFIQENDGSLTPIGEFTRNQKTSKQALQQAGLFREGAKFAATITSRLSTAKIILEPESLVYPESEKPKPPAPLQSPTGLAGKLIETLSHQPTLLHHFQQEWQLPDGEVERLPTWGLTIDLERIQASQQYLSDKKIPFTTLHPDDPRVSLERERGYGVIWLLQSELPTRVKAQIEASTKESYSADLTNLSQVSPYVERLMSMAALSEKQLNQRLEESVSAFSQVCQNLPQKADNRPATIQAARTQIVSPIIKAYLDLAEKTHFQGKYYTATWDGETQMLSLLQSNQLKLLARWENQRWQPLPIPLKDPNQPNLSKVDVAHFQGLEPRIQERLSQRLDNYRAWYESARSQVLATQTLDSEEAIDREISLTVAQESGDLADVRKVLAHSVLLRTWREEMPAQSFQQKSAGYIESVCRGVEETGGRGQEEKDRRRELEIG